MTLCSALVLIILLVSEWIAYTTIILVPELGVDPDRDLRMTIHINITLHNGADGALLWSYDHTDKGGLANSVEAMTKSLLKKVAGNFPYRKEK